MLRLTPDPDGTLVGHGEHGTSVRVHDRGHGRWVATVFVTTDEGVTSRPPTVLEARELSRAMAWRQTVREMHADIGRSVVTA
ncbi:MAG: hypothetical protein M0P31_18875 [Solirubrobacteraceae bacterium]|nr:hypothetical protein [Solirubrobacteraceae bacterium]